MEIPEIIFSMSMDFLTVENGSGKGKVPDSCNEQRCCQPHLWYLSSGNAITVFKVLFLNMLANM